MKSQNYDASADAPAIQKGFWPELSVKLLVIAATFIAALFIFGFITHEVVFEKEEVFDQRVFNFLDHHTNPAFEKVMRFFTFFGSHTFLIPAYAVIALYFIVKKRARRAINILIIAISSSALMFALKEIFKRNRPEIPLVRTIKTFSFPSGHALTSFVFCSVLIYLVWHTRLNTTTRWIFTILLLLLSIVIGISRIVLKFHYATDVIAGLCLGFAWALPSFFLLRKIEQSKVIHQL